MMLPGFVWMFISGMNFIRFNKANDVARATALMYIKGQDMTVLGTQEILARVGKGLDLEVDNGRAPPNEVQSNAKGNACGRHRGAIRRTQHLQQCTNLNQYVLQRVYIGNTSLQFNGSTVQSALGNPLSTIWSTTTGDVSSVYTNTGARVNSSFASLWFRRSLTDRSFTSSSSSLPTGLVRARSAAAECT